MKKLPFAVLLLSVAFPYCNTKKEHNPEDSPTKGHITISVDETFKPVIEKQIEMYQATWPETSISARYKSEENCIRDFFNDSLISMVIVTRPLNEKEMNYYKEWKQKRPDMLLLAYDAVAVVLNKNNNDTLLTTGYLKKLLSGDAKDGKVAVFDGFNATSTVRFAIDSIMKGSAFDTSSVRAVANSQAVLDYVAENPNAIGFVGFSWIGNPEKPEQVDMLKKIKLAYLPCIHCDTPVYVKPSQYNISTKEYPMVRGLYYILKDNYPGLGYGFGSFMKYERGQLIFRRAYLGVTMGLGIREVSLDSNLKKQ